MVIDYLRYFCLIIIAGIMNNTILSLRDVKFHYGGLKAVSDLYAPVSGTVAEVNQQLNDEPELVNSDPYEEGRMLRIEMSDASEVEGLLETEEYKVFVEEESG